MQATCMISPKFLTPLHLGLCSFWFSICSHSIRNTWGHLLTNTPISYDISIHKVMRLNEMWHLIVAVVAVEVCTLISPLPSMFTRCKGTLTYHKTFSCAMLHLVTALGLEVYQILAYLTCTIPFMSCGHLLCRTPPLLCTVYKEWYLIQYLP